MENGENPILHVCVVGFHHKKGCQLEYAYPPLIEGNPPDSNQLPEQWKHLPSMAIPDGAHNFNKDTIYFHLSARDGSSHTVFGISCYRQISAHSLVNRTADVTRGTVQKSVCVLSKLPLYGLIQAKLELITHAYFEELDFTKVSLLEDTYKSLSQSISLSAIKGSQVFLGMSACDVVRKYRHSILVLFKLLLLERRVLFYMSPVEALNNIMLGVVSLFPNMIESGLCEAAGQRAPLYADDLQVQHYDSEEYLELAYVREQRDCPDIIKSHVPTSASVDVMTSRDVTVTSPRRSLTSPDVDTWVSLEEGAVGGTTPTSTSRQNSCESTSKLTDVGNVDDLSSPVSSSAKYIQPRPSVVCEQPRPQELADESTDTVHNNQILDPLANIETVTSLQRIQNEPITDDHMPLEISVRSDELGLQSDGKNDDLHNLFLTKVQGQSQGHDLDSPESLHEIDQEDCFSWEEDRLLLEIEEELVKEKRPETSGISGSRTSGQGEGQGHFMNKNLLQRVDSDSGISSCSSKDKTGSVQSRSSHCESGDASPRMVTCSDKMAANSNSDKMADNSNNDKMAANSSSAIQTESGPHREREGVHSPHSVKDSIKSLDHVDQNRLDTRSETSSVHEETNLETDECGFPLALFTKGSVCHPYLSLQYYSLLEDVNIRSFTIGATNILFKQKRLLTDAVVGDNESLIEIRDSELKKQLALTTADLRFADYIVKNVCQESQDVFLDGTGWEGGEEWIRVQFRMYLMSLLVTAKHGDEKLEEDFGSHFVSAMKTTHHYRVWLKDPNVRLGQIEAGHPFQGQVSISDMKLRWVAAMQNTGKGRKINAAVHNTGKAAMQAGKAVGGAFSSAKSAVSGWFGGWAKEK